MTQVPMPRPWIRLNDQDELICLMCPKHRQDRHGNECYAFVRTGPGRRRDRVRRWVYHHLGCGFEGLR